ncbi:uncharacterized protein LOC144109540 [Amblyomma americanum]
MAPRLWLLPRLRLQLRDLCLLPLLPWPWSESSSLNQRGLRARLRLRRWPFWGVPSSSSFLDVDSLSPLRPPHLARRMRTAVGAPAPAAPHVTSRGAQGVPR